MLVADIPCIHGDYRIVDTKGTVLHYYFGFQDNDDIPPDVATRRIIDIMADNDKVVVEVASMVDEFYEDLKKYFNITYATVGCSLDWIQSRVEDIAEMTETYYIHLDSKFTEEADGLDRYLCGYLHGMDDFNSCIGGNPDEYIEEMESCKTFEEFMKWLHEEVKNHE